ncbi:MAG: hypothetical protein KDD69_06775 [Bdellovibrionales bacterium]|nr:hypothetical protein [Bdellovibrionales bacterium]
MKVATQNSRPSVPKRRHLPFRSTPIAAALLLAIALGFGLGALLVWRIAFDRALPIALGKLIQVHGHVQLFAWTGLFIVAVSLYKIPRLTSTKPVTPLEYYLLLGSLLGGILFRVNGQLWISGSSELVALRFLVSLGCLLEGIGILLFLAIVLRRIIRYRPQPAAIAAAALKPFLLLSILGWLLYAGVTIVLGIRFLQGHGVMVDLFWNDLGTRIYIHLVLLPTCFAFSLATFPIFLRLAPPIWRIPRLVIVYGTATILYVISAEAGTAGSDTLRYWMHALGTTVRLIAIVGVILGLDLLRLRPPWFERFRGRTERENRPPRRFAADYGQFGNFEWLIYAAYAWLFLAAGADVLLLALPSAYPFSVVRHLYLLGFVTHLILGMAVRIIPGFLGRNRIAYQSLVRASFALILFATFARTLPLVSGLHGIVPLRSAYGLSGIAAVLAIACLAINLATTIAQDRRA